VSRKKYRSELCILKSIDSINPVLAPSNQYIVSGVQRTANATETAIV